MNTSVAIGVIVYFIFKDLKFMKTLTDTLVTLVKTVDTLKDVIEKERSED
jgi:hypothetical protein